MELQRTRGCKHEISRQALGTVTSACSPHLPLNLQPDQAKERNPFLRPCA